MDKVISLGECLFTLVGGSVVLWGIWRAWKPATGAKIRAMVNPPHMSSVDPVAASSDVVVPIPVSDTGIPDIGDILVSPHHNAVSRRMSEIDIIALLAVQRKGNEYRYSGNKIYELVRGNRNDVLQVIKEVRDTNTQYVSDMIKRVNQEVQNGS
jgi:hypothetical protein